MTRNAVHYALFPEVITLIICTPNVLTPEELRAIRIEIGGAAFIDGAATAGYSARGVKKNLQISVDDKNDARMQEMIRHAFTRNVRLQASLLPAVKSKALFNRYDVGMEYGLHVDSAVMGGLGDALRTDIAMTIFLSEPESYDGGELLMSMNGMEFEFKLPAGSAIAYPANTLHRVKPVTRGARYGAIIWVQSQVRDAARRELLWDLTLAKGETFKREGKSATFDAIDRSYANLMRMWVDL